MRNEGPNTARGYLPLKRLADILAGLGGLVALALIGPVVGLGLLATGHAGVLQGVEVLGQERRRRRECPQTGDRRKVWQPARPLTLHVFRTRRAGGPQTPSPMGRALLACGLVDLPLAWPLLLGRISLVGPQILPMAVSLRLGATGLGLKPGVTGLSQLADHLEPGPDVWRRRLALDRRYEQTAGPRLDLTILLFTILDGRSAGSPAA